MAKIEESLVWYEKALNINPDHADSLYHKGLALKKLGRNNEDRGVFIGREAEELARSVDLNLLPET